MRRQNKLRRNTIHPEKKRSSLFVSLEEEMDMRKDTEKCARRKTLRRAGRPSVQQQKRKKDLLSK